MTGSPYSPTAILIRLSPLQPGETAPGSPGDRYDLAGTQELRLGRNPDCTVALDPEAWLMVSRYHAAIQAFPARRGRSRVVWQLRDLDSANGTYVNGQAIEEAHWLVSGDRIQLGNTGPCFQFELPGRDPRPPRSSAPRPTPSPGISPPLLTVSQLFPLASTSSELLDHPALLPGLITIAMVVSLFTAFGDPLTFNRLLALYVSLGSYYFFIYRPCGKSKPWWVLALTALATALLLESPLTPASLWFFRDVLPGALPQPEENLSWGVQFGRLLVGTGLMEEWLKLVPVVGVWAVGRLLASPWRERVGLWEPLDGILLGAASAVGFTLAETLGQYVPQVVTQIAAQSGTEAGQLAGLQLLIPRLLGAIAGHMAYSGYLGYFVGLSVLRSRRRWAILAVGYASAAFLHALWNLSGTGNSFLLMGAGFLSYVLLLGAILKARALSPTQP